MHTLYVYGAVHHLLVLSTRVLVLMHGVYCYYSRDSVVYRHLQDISQDLSDTNIETSGPLQTLSDLGMRSVCRVLVYYVPVSILTRART